MPSSAKQVPKHAPKHRAPSTRRAPRAALRTTLTLSSMAVVATGFAVGGGSLSLSAQPTDESSLSAAEGRVLDSVLATVKPLAEAAADETAEADEERAEIVSRSDRRQTADPLKETTLELGGDNAMARTEDLSDEDPRVIGRALLAEYGWSSEQFGCLDSLWTRESNWRVDAENPSSGAYGIPQSLPGSKMASVAPDWRTNPITQIRWGLGYIGDRYGSPCGAWGFFQGHNWY